MCAHVAAVIWFLGYARHEEIIRLPQTKVLNTVQDVGNRHAAL